MFSEKNFYLVGIGGIGMSGLARVLRESGKNISGSDIEESPITKKLQEEGFNLKLNQKSENIPSETEVVIYTTAARKDNPEILEAGKRNLKVISYPEALGILTQEKKLVAVAGAHGKTTTTSLIISACLAAGEDISCLVGTNLKELAGGNARVGKSDWFILEACEYRRAFLNLSPEILVITNIEAEHLDYYRDLGDYKSAFIELAQKSQKVIANSLEKNMKEIIPAASEFFNAGNINENFDLKIPGEHNRRNASLAFATAKLMNLDLSGSKTGIESFVGGWRRFEFKGEFNGAKIFDDYAHHPTEIRATLSAAREKYSGRRIVIVYQQHQLDRAAKMLPELGQSFSTADVIVIPNIYKVRDEVNEVKITGEDLANEIRKNSKPEQEIHYTRDFDHTAEWLKNNLEPKDLVLIAGAGDVFRITEKLLA